MARVAVGGRLAVGLVLVLVLALVVGTWKIQGMSSKSEAK